MRPKTIRGWNIDEGAVAGHWASLTLALLGCGFFFPVLHQSRLLTSNKLLQGSPGSRLRRTLSHPVWLACSYLPKWAPQKKRKLHPDSHTVNQAGLKVPVVHFQVLFRLLSHLALSVFFFSHPLCLFLLSPSSGSVPTVPPGNVQAEPVNSTTVRFTWSAPSPQFINGINQGYKVSPAPFCQLVHSSGRRQTSTQSVQISFRLQQWWDVFLSGV